MAEVLDNIKIVGEWASIAIGGVGAILIWLFKSKHGEHVEMYKAYSEGKARAISLEKEHSDMHIYYIKNKEVSLVDIVIQNQRILDRIEHTNDNNKAGAAMIMDAWERSDKKMDKLQVTNDLRITRLEERIDQIHFRKDQH
jgi:hypothetical protein